MTWAMLAQAGDPDTSRRLVSVVSPFMGVFFGAFFMAFLMTPVLRELAIRNGIIDWPDLKRKNHLKPVAYLGGVAIFLGWFVGVGICFLLWPETDSVLISVILGAAAITITGFLDDVYHMSPRVKIGGQLFAAAALASQNVGVKLAESFVNVIGLADFIPDQIVYILGTLIIAVFIIGGCNATNLMDGLDGLASGVSAIAALGFLIIAALVARNDISTGSAFVGIASVEDAIRICVILALLGAVAGFLPYNFNPASIFMGDAGSLLLGYLCMTSILLFTPDTGTYAPKLVTALLIVFALPITDTLLAIIRRKIDGKPITAPDNEHIHHLLRRSGLGVKQTVIFMYTMGFAFACLGVWMVWYELQWRHMLAIFFPLYCFIMVVAYHYAQNLILRDKLKANGEIEDDQTIAELPEVKRENEDDELNKTV